MSNIIINPSSEHLKMSSNSKNTTSFNFSNTSPPMKRKRGRPPKADSLSTRITTTMNINVNTSPLNSSPTAESNSNLITRRKNPDYYTSILKVSPNKLSSPLKSSSPLKKRSKSKTGLISPSNDSPTKKHKLNDQLVTPYSIDQKTDPKPEKKDNGFQLKLTVDDSGKAVLSNDLFKRSLSETNLSGPATTNPPSTSTDTSTGPNLLRRHNSDFTGINTSNVYAPNLNSINEHDSSPLDKLNNKSSILPQLPQTPKIKENYLYSSTGLTPSSNFLSNNLSFNLTPQFNSMMYSMMNINSPQLKISSNNQQFLSNQDFFMNQNNSPINNTINMNELMSLTHDSSIKDSKISDEEVNTSTSNSNDENGDAKSALKKIIHIKRK
ncbi:hypothetical protein HYPBUDRAFT_152722 [Hyphopichia burtonii NRRL Y-1933]|uniref:Uncharacterized protein n=1 Tax=Hyphopichia burtonii NRRL Y-1933 TaxID=984485 RepID=A0A1E4RLI6_9ASCO|nr:hypothetical protein HYPBUDRAFT_152722 [Hyphopichia burtonii NRRL Y-1933]ODV68061.1 hypothetical protein HYPBUDRAFT_152722 [Hyphopichia burtonii NRRL Y-1933]